MNETTTSTGVIGTTATLGYSGTINGGTGAFFSPGVNIYDSSSNYSLATAITNSNNMNKQVKVAVFTVERNEDNKVTSSTFVKELWVEVKNGASLELSVAKQLDKDFDPSTTIIKEINSFTF
jgi:hypothetical protein